MKSLVEAALRAQIEARCGPFPKAEDFSAIPSNAGMLESDTDNWSAQRARRRAKRMRTQRRLGR